MKISLDFQNLSFMGMTDYAQLLGYLTLKLQIRCSVAVDVCVCEYILPLVEQPLPLV